MDRLVVFRRFGIEVTIPTNDTSPEATAVVIKAKALPRAMSLRFTGVKSIEAIVPLSFSPATASGAMEMTVEKRSEVVIIGTMNAIICAPRKSLPVMFGGIRRSSSERLTT